MHSSTKIHVIPTSFLNYLLINDYNFIKFYSPPHDDRRNSIIGFAEITANFPVSVSIFINDYKPRRAGSPAQKI